MQNDNRYGYQSNIELKTRFVEVVCHNGQRHILLKSPATDKKISIPLQAKDKIPASGLFLGENILANTDKPAFKKVLGIGSGKYAPTEFCCISIWDAEIVEGVEINSVEAEFANQVARSNSLSHRLRIHTGHLFNPINDRDYDLILSNIAQMPLTPNSTPSLHDHGGDDGWLLLDQIIKQAPTFLKSDGLLSLLVFDFLGVFERTNPTKMSLIDRLRAANFKVIHQASFKRKIRLGGETHKSIEYILELYPACKFYNRSGMPVSNLNTPKALANGDSIYLELFVVTSKLD
jgi:hypothetical protein